jgi:hypothetical protein
MKKIGLLVLLCVAWLIGPALFFVTEGRHGLAGFPLDDSWIHQSYARSLAGGEGWSYAGGAPSAGSTSPAWTALQAPAYWLHISPIIWSTVLGCLLLLANGFFLYRWIQSIQPKAALFAMIFSLGEWHLVWAGLSGMETILFCGWISASLYFWYRIRQTSSYQFLPLAVFGLLLGIGIGIRPEAILFTGTAILAAWLGWRGIDWRHRTVLLFSSTMGIAAYFGFELALHGRIWPNTFYAKPAEYLSQTADSLLHRLSQPWIPLLAGPFAILCGFLIVFLWIQIRQKHWQNLWPLVWALLHLVLFSIQLPVSYQHGRYFIPMLPILMSLSICGYIQLAEKGFHRQFVRVIGQAGWLSACLLLAIYLWIGAGQFVEDVGIIDTEMVQTAQWIQTNTPSDSNIAAHDIGALGFFGQRKIVDLGGLTDLDALEVLSGKQPLSVYLAQKHADYLMTFVGSYPSDLSGCTPIWSQAGTDTISPNNRNMAVYRWADGCLNAQNHQLNPRQFAKVRR